MEAKNRHYYMNHSAQTLRSEYEDGNAVRKLYAVPDVRREEREAEVPSPRKRTHNQPKTLSGIGLASLFVLSIAIMATLYFCVEYLKLQSEVTTMEKEIVNKEETLTAMNNENEAAYAQIKTTYDLNYVFRVAVKELGMVYPNKNKVITYDSGAQDYVRQYKDIPQK